MELILTRKEGETITIEPLGDIDDGDYSEGQKREPEHRQ